MRLAPQRVIAGKGKPAAQGDSPELGLSVRSRGSCGSQRDPDSSRQRLSPHRDPAGPARGEPAPFSAPKHGGVTAPAESFPSLPCIRLAVEILLSIVRSSFYTLAAKGFYY